MFTATGSAISNGRASSCTAFGKVPASFPIPAYRARSSGRVSIISKRIWHIGELMRWLLETEEGRGKLDRTHRDLRTGALGRSSMHVALMPVLDAFAAELRI
jgi:hypothetical protein